MRALQAIVGVFLLGLTAVQANDAVAVQADDAVEDHDQENSASQGKRSLVRREPSKHMDNPPVEQQTFEHLAATTASALASSGGAAEALVALPADGGSDLGHDGTGGAEALEAGLADGGSDHGHDSIEGAEALAAGTTPETEALHVLASPHSQPDAVDADTLLLFEAGALPQIEVEFSEGLVLDLSAMKPNLKCDTEIRARVLEGLVAAMRSITQAPFKLSSVKYEWCPQAKTNVGAVSFKTQWLTLANAAGIVDLMLKQTNKAILSSKVQEKLTGARVKATVTSVGSPALTSK